MVVDPSMTPCSFPLCPVDCDWTLCCSHLSVWSDWLRRPSIEPQISEAHVLGIPAVGIVLSLTVAWLHVRVQDRLLFNKIWTSMHACGEFVCLKLPFTSGKGKHPLKWFWSQLATRNQEPSQKIQKAAVFPFVLLQQQNDQMLLVEVQVAQARRVDCKAWSLPGLQLVDTVWIRCCPGSKHRVRRSSADAEGGARPTWEI